MSGAGTPPPPPPPPPGIPNRSAKPLAPPLVPWYWQTWFVVLALILVFPAGLILLWTRKPQWGLTARWITSAVVVALAAIVFASVGAGAGQTKSSPPGSQTTPAIGGDTPATTADTTPVATATPTPTPTPTPTATPAPTPPTPTLIPTAAPTAVPVNLCGAPPNPWGYNFCGGGLIYSPDPSFCS